MANEVAVIRDYDIRDKKLVDATAQSTINSTDAIEMKTTDGNQVFIDKASFIKAVGQAFTASDPKTFTKLLGMNGDGPMGIGASDLASVLGVTQYDGNLDNAPDGISYGFVGSGNVPGVTTLGIVAFLSIRDLDGQFAGLQIAVGVNYPSQVDHIKYRAQWHGSNTWSEWQEV